MEVRAAALLFGFFLDFLFGDPRWLCHPVRLIGSAISAAEKGIRSVFPQTPRGERAGGILLILLIGSASFALPFFEKPTIGDDLRHPEPEDIKRANGLMYGCSLLAAAVFGIILMCIGWKF